MNRAKLMALGLGLALVALFAAPAAAQDAPTLTVDPATVDAAGEVEFSFSGEGFTVSPIFVLPCIIPASGNPEDVGDGDCDTANLAINAHEDGTFTGTLTVDVPAEGIIIAASDQEATERAAVVITIGGGDAPVEDEAPAEDPVEETMPETGAESAPLAIAGGAILAAGTMLYGFSRRYK